MDKFIQIVSNYCLKTLVDLQAAPSNLFFLCNQLEPMIADKISVLKWFYLYFRVRKFRQLLVPECKRHICFPLPSVDRTTAAFKYLTIQSLFWTATTTAAAALHSIKASFISLACQEREQRAYTERPSSISSEEEFVSRLVSSRL